MLIAISSTTADVAGHAFIDVLPETAAGELGRRISRIATLDGSAAFVDGGFSESDRVMQFEWSPGSKVVEDNIIRLFSTYPWLTVSIPAGVFRVTPEQYRPGADRNSMRLLSAGKVSI